MDDSLLIITLQIFNVAGVGVVAAGLLTKGLIREFENMLVGPFADGSFKAVTVDTVHRNKQPCRVVSISDLFDTNLNHYCLVLKF